MLFLQPGDTLACAVRRFLVWLHTSDIPQELISHLRGRRRGKKKEKKKNKKKNKMHCPSAHSLSLSAYLLVTVEVWFSRTTCKRRSSIDTPCPCADDTPGKSSGEHDYDSIKPEIN